MSKRRDHQILGAAGVVAVVVGVCFVASLRTELELPVPSTLVVDRHNVPLTEVEGGDRDDRFGYWPLPYVLPLRLVVATLQTEDRHFFEHRGVHVASVARATKQNLESLRVVSGASTIPMQVARMQSGRSRGFISKIQEATEALVLTDRYGHDALLRHYLTLAPYGARVHGAARAARFYFDKPVEDLSWLQAAWLAGLPQQPTKMSPFTEDGRRRGLARARRILTALHEQRYLDDHDLQVALESDLGVVDRRPRPGTALHYALLMTDEVKAARRTRASEGLAQLTQVKSSLDLEVQQTTTSILQKNLESVRALGATNSAAIVIDTGSGEVRGWVGSVDYFDDDAHGAIDFNRVKRSPGSTLKPFLYGLALDTATRATSQVVYTAATPLADVPMDVVGENGKSYLPKNINKSFLGPMSLREALGNSRNIPALRVLGDVGVDRLLELMDDGGVDDVSFEPGRYGLGLALGNLHTTPEELARLYLALQNGGVSKPLRFSDVDAAAPAPKRLLAPEASALVTHILADDTARRPSFPEGSALDFDIAVAIKTGTSQGFRDGWTVAFTDRLLVVVWVGNHDWRRMNHLGGLAGTADAAHELIEALSPSWKRHVPMPQSMPVPPDSEQRVVCALSGQLAGAECPHHRSEHFLPGTTPVASCDWHRRVDVDVRTGDLATSHCPTHVVERRAVTALPATYQRWARSKRLALAPIRASRLCGGDDAPAATEVVLTEPRDGVRYTFDPDTPPEYATLRLAADVDGGPDEQVVFLVDGTPVATASFPFEARWTLTPGRHTIQAVLSRRSSTSSPATILVRQ
ncbi:MAG: transglycosylase domain-containing protein [Deltaproteobacteria bacterium]|nr:transglycosylase domain-containing protein [Deltaproteobacteria bacterium]